MSKDSRARALQAGYLRQVSCYTLALGHAENLLAALRQGQESSGHLEQLLAAFNEITALDAGLAAARRPGAASPSQPGEDLRPLQARVAELAAQLFERVKLAEQEATARRDRIAPALDQALRVRRMRGAYKQQG